MSAPDSPTRVNRNANDADCASRRKSAASAITDPAPAATPLTAAMTGIGSSRSALDDGAGHPRELAQLGGLALDQLADDLLDVPARAEPASLAGDHQHPGVAAVGQLGDEIAEVCVGLERESIRACRAGSG